jgi:hypothetical protein
LAAVRGVPKVCGRTLSFYKAIKDKTYEAIHLKEKQMNLRTGFMTKALRIALILGSLQ